jgi:hypothetical protein
VTEQQIQARQELTNYHTLQVPSLGILHRIYSVHPPARFFSSWRLLSLYERVRLVGIESNVQPAP